MSLQLLKKPPIDTPVTDFVWNRWFQDVRDEVSQPLYNLKIINVRDYGVLGDGLTDDTTGINLAVAAAANGILYFPPGTYLISSLATITNPMVIYGAGPEVTQIKTTSATSNIITSTAADVRISGLKFTTSVTRTAGTVLVFGTNAHRCSVTDCYFDAIFHGISISSNSCRVYRCTAINSIAGSGFLSLAAGTDTTVMDLDITAASQSASAIAINIIGQSRVTITNVTMGFMAVGIRVAPGSGQTCRYIKMVNCTAVATTNQAFLFATTGGGTASNITCVNCESYTTSAGQGWYLAGLNTSFLQNVTLVNCGAYSSTSFGIYSAGYVIHLQITGGFVSAGLTHGVYFSAETSNVSITGATIGDSRGLGGNAGWGVVVTASCIAISIIGCTLAGNTSGPITNASKSTDPYAIEIGNIPMITASWTAATGTATRSTFATGSVTTAQLAERVKALIDDLKEQRILG